MNEKNHRSVSGLPLVASAQVMNTLNAGLLLAVGVLGDPAYYVQLQLLISLISVAGFLHLGIPDGVFQRKISTTQAFPLNFKSREQIVALTTAVGAIGIMLATATTEATFILAYLLSALTINQISLVNSSNSGNGRYDIQFKAQIIERFCSVIALSAIAILGFQLSLLWVPLSMIPGYLFARAAVREQGNDQSPIGIWQDVNAGIRVMLANIAYFAVIPIAIYFYSSVNDKSAARDLILGVQFSQMVVSYGVAYSTVLMASKGDEMAGVTHIKIAALSYLVFSLLLCALAPVFTDQFSSLVNISRAVILCSPYVFLELLNQPVISRIRRANGVDALVRTNVACLSIFLVTVIVVETILALQVSVVVPLGLAAAGSLRFVLLRRQK